MVLIEHVGFGGRDRDLWLYYWDERDGAECNGWWVTPDFIGNNEFFLASSGSAATVPIECACGSWRSPNVEMLQLKRQLEIGFVPGDDGLVATGADAATPIVPDQVCRIDFSKVAWVEAGLNHGRPCYRGVERKLAAPAKAHDDARVDPHPQPVVLLALGVAAGVVAVLAAQRLARR